MGTRNWSAGCSDGEPILFPLKVAAQYHQHIYGDWTKNLRERGYYAIAEVIESKIHERYGPPLDEGDIRQAVREGNLDRMRALLD